jgi:hypothetical protein
MGSDDPRQFERAQCERVNAVLRGYDGGLAQLWEYTVSLRKLTIRVTLMDLHKNCHILCGPCRHLATCTDWEPARIEVGFDEQRDEYVLVDAAANVRISFGGIDIVENVEPIF